MSPGVQILRATTPIHSLSGVNGVQCWGSNYDGQLGRSGPSSATAVTVPFGEPVEDLEGRVDWTLGTGLTSVCARLASGQVRCWGNNENGQLGLPHLHWRDAPAQVVE